MRVCLARNQELDARDQEDFLNLTNAPDLLAKLENWADAIEEMPTNPTNSSVQKVTGVMGLGNMGKVEAPHAKRSTQRSTHAVRTSVMMRHLQ